MKVAVNYTTFARDKEWLRKSLDSFKKYCTGFSAVTIVVPTWDVDKFLEFEAYSTEGCPVRIKNFLEYPGKGFVHHLAMKCYADVFQPDATHILHMDPDCLFCKPTSPKDYIRVGESTFSPYSLVEFPVLVIEPYEVLKTTHPARYNWKRVTEEALKFECTHETMCRHPAVHLSTTYKEVRSYIESQHLTPFYDFVIKQKNQYPQGFGEFNTLGAYCLKYNYGWYDFIDRGDQGDKNDPPSHVWQGWSYTGVNSPENAAKIREILG